VFRAAPSEASHIMSTRSPPTYGVKRDHKCGLGCSGKIRTREFWGKRVELRAEQQPGPWGRNRIWGKRTRWRAREEWRELRGARDLKNKKKLRKRDTGSSLPAKED